MKELFIEKRFNPETELMIAKLNEIIREYTSKGYVLSLRQVYYQLVARGVVENSLQSYKRIGNIVSDARLAGLIDWSAIEDRNRETITPPMWDSPAQIVEAAASQFAIDRWADQDYHVEVCVEKAALEGVLIPVCKRLGIRFTANRGYSSSSALYEMGKRLHSKARSEGKIIYVIYLGDFDPSGVDMTRDVAVRLELFSGVNMEVKRLALNFDQVEELHPPENPAKLTDSRAKAYIAKYGDSSWELDAVSPEKLVELVTDTVVGLRDETLWQEAIDRENEMKDELLSFVQKYNDRKDRADIEPRGD